MGRHLKVHAAQCSLSLVKREVALHQFAVEPLSLELLLTPRAGKKSTLVEFGLNVDFKNSREFGLVKDHAWRPPFRRGSVREVRL
jgi:hypothetical protein